MATRLANLRRLCVTISFILSPFIFSAQVSEFLFEKAAVGLKTEDLKLFAEGKAKFQQGQYLEALAFFRNISEKEQVYLNYIKGVCFSYDPSNKPRALKGILGAWEKQNEIDGYFYNLAYAYVKNDSMEAAIKYYNKALEIELARKNVNKPLVNEINLSIQHCQNLLDLKEKKNYVKVTNLGPPVNTMADEYCPLIPSNEGMMIYTYRGPNAKGGKQKIKGSKLRNIDDVELYFEDIFYTTRINDTLWSEPSGIENLNTGTHDAAVSLNADGTELFVYRNKGEGKGDLYLSELAGNSWSKPVYQLKLNSPEWDGSACFVPNSNLIIFASERKGGFGGKDLYYAERVGENMWGEIKNLGPVINSRFDEDAPFITSDGKILFFGSNNKNSFGGYDIFRCDLVNKEWQTPYNLGPPINTTNDDNYFTVRADGKVAYYSSYKKGSDGGQDIYKVEPGVPGRPMTLLQVEGLVTVDGKPTPAEVDIRAIRNNKEIHFSINANKKTGIFLTNLPAGDEYELQVTVEKFPPQVIQLNTLDIDSFVLLNVFADFASPNYTTAIDKTVSAENDVNVSQGNFDKNSFSAKFGTLAMPEVKYHVQVAALRFSNNFDYNRIVGLPKIVKHTDKDKISRFTMGDFDTYNAAYQLLQEVQKGAFKDAFITAEYNGERKLLSQLVEEKILQRD
jgi:tetratricopeptide (TPR) repeat protein